MKLTTKIFNTAKITGFTSNDATLKVYFTAEKEGCEPRKYSAIAHPAFRVTPHINKLQELVIAVTETGWKLISPQPTEEDIKAFTEARKVTDTSPIKLYEETEVEYSEASVAFITSF